VLPLALVSAGVYALYKHPPMEAVPHGDIAFRSNRLTGHTSEFHERQRAGAARPARAAPLFDARPRVPPAGQRQFASGPAPFQSIEGLSLGVDLSIRYALDPARIGSIAGTLPDDVDGEVVQPAVQGVIYKIFTATR